MSLLPLVSKLPELDYQLKQVWNGLEMEMAGPLQRGGELN